MDSVWGRSRKIRGVERVSGDLRNIQETFRGIPGDFQGCTYAHESISRVLGDFKGDSGNIRSFYGCFRAFQGT